MARQNCGRRRATGGGLPAAAATRAYSRRYVGRVATAAGYPYNWHVAKWKPLGAHKKQKRTAGKSRLISCLALLAGILVLFFLLFYLVLQKSGG